MKHPVKFTFLGFYLNSLVDRGKFVELEEIHKHIRNKTLFSWLGEKYSDYLDLSLYSIDELNEIVGFFDGLSTAVDEERKMGISKNGLCLLVAYCFEGLQRKPGEFKY